MTPMTLIEEVRARRLPSPKTRRAIRLAAGVSQARMAAEMEVHRQTLIRWETGAIEPQGSNRERYAALLGALRQVSS